MIVIDLLFYLCFKVDYKHSFFCTDCILCVFYLMLLWLINGWLIAEKYI